MIRFYAGAAYQERGHATYRWMMPTPFVSNPSPWIVGDRPDSYATRQWVVRDAEQGDANRMRSQTFAIKGRLGLASVSREAKART